MGAQEQLKYEYLMRALYKCRQGEYPGVEADAWMFFEGDKKEIKNIKKYINSAIDFQISELRDLYNEIESERINKLLDFKVTLNNTTDHLSMKSLVFDMYDYCTAKLQ